MDERNWVNPRDIIRGDSCSNVHDVEAESYFTFLPSLKSMFLKRPHYTVAKFKNIFGAFAHKICTFFKQCTQTQTNFYMSNIHFHNQLFHFASNQPCTPTQPKRKRKKNHKSLCHLCHTKVNV